MRRVLSVLGAVLTAPAFVVVPVLSAPAVAPKPVTPQVQDVAVAPLPATTGVVADTGPRRTKRFQVLGATWRRGSLASGVHVQVRTRSGRHWSSWDDLTASDGGPDAGSRDARAAARLATVATEPLLVGAADGVEARVVSPAGQRVAAPAGLHLVLVDGGRSRADASPGPAHVLGGSVAEAAQVQPTIYTRAQWGADERLRSRNPGCGRVDYGSTIKMGFIHHTDGANSYSSGQVPSILRSIYAYHVESNGWCDIGYNFLVDRFGRVWEGRYGGIDKPVIGAHTGGFNADSFGTSLIGNYSSVTPSSAMLTAVERLYAWKLGSYFRNPLGTTTMRAASFSGSRYAAGSTVTFNVISGHRDADTTTCPGTAAYKLLPTIRKAVASYIGAGFVSPVVSPASVRMLSGQTFRLRAGVLTPQDWSLSVVDSAGTTIRTTTGSTTVDAGISSVWDATGADGLPVPPGTYTLRLTGANAAGSTDVPYVQQVTVSPPVTVVAPATAAYGATVPVTGLAAPNATVSLSVQQGSRPADVQSLTASPAGAWSTTFTISDDSSLVATVDSWSSPTSNVRVAPTLTSPQPVTGSSNAFLRSGTSITPAGTGLPGSTVQVVATAAGQDPVTSSAIPVRADGTWTAPTMTPGTATTVLAQRAPGVASSAVQVYPVGTPTASAPTSGYSQRTFTATGNAGNAPVTVQLSLRAPGAGADTVVDTVTARADGAFSVVATLPTVASATDVPWHITTSVGATQFGTAAGTISVLPAYPPTATSRTWGYYGFTIPISGKAVPGDVVKLQTRPVGASAWTTMSSATADASSGAFTMSWTLRRDTQWRVTSRSGVTTPATVVVHPAVRVPSRVRNGALVQAWGWAIPGQKVAVYRRPVGTSGWRYVGTVTAGSTGRWQGHWHEIYSMNVQVRSNKQVSGVVTIKAV